jgi:hypothetical protein
MNKNVSFLSRGDLTDDSASLILQSPYSSTYEKPLRILKVDSEGRQQIETSTSVYKTINDSVSIEKIKQICEKIIDERMAASISSFLSSINEHFLQMEKRLISFLETKQTSLSDIQQKSFDELKEQTEKQIKDIDDKVRTQMFDSNIMKIIQEEVKNALENISEKDLNDEDNLGRVLGIDSVLVDEDYYNDGVKQETQTLQQVVENIEEQEIQKQVVVEEVKQVVQEEKEIQNQVVVQEAIQKQVVEEEEIQNQVVEEEAIQNQVVQEEAIQNQVVVQEKQIQNQVVEEVKQVVQEEEKQNRVVVQEKEIQNQVVQEEDVKQVVEENKIPQVEEDAGLLRIVEENPNGQRKQRKKKIIRFKTPKKSQN